MRLIDLMNCMKNEHEMIVHLRLVNGKTKCIEGTKEKVFGLRDEMVWTGRVEKIEAAKKNLLEVWTR